MKIREGETASAIGENPKSVADAEHRDRVLARAKATIERVESLERAAPVAYEEFDLQSYLASFPRPLR